MALHLASLVQRPLLASHPNVQQQTLERTEYSSLRTQLNESVPPRGQLMKHQEVVARWMLHNDRAFNTSDPGTGKTCAVIGAIERLRKARKQGKLIGNIRHAYLIVPKSLKNEIKNQLHCVCTHPDDVKAGDIDDFYTVTTYQTFANEVVKGIFQDGWNVGTVVAYIKERFSNCFFYCDESQIVANIHAYDDGSLTTQEPLFAQQLWSIYQLSSRTVVNDKQQTSEVRSASEYQVMYYVLWLIFHVALHTKVMLGSGTPDINRVYDIVMQFNLLAAEGRQMKRSDAEQQSWRAIAQHFKGMFFYIRMPENGVRFVQPGFPLPNGYQKNIDGMNVMIPSQSRVVPMQMLGPQYRNYMSQPDNNNNSLGSASLFCFPVNVPVGMSASSVAAGDMCYTEDSGGLRATLQYADYLRSYDNVRNSGASYAAMLQLCWGRSTWTDELIANMGDPHPYHNQLHRKVFIFCDLKNGPGVFNMGLALHHCQAPIDLGQGMRSMWRYEANKADFVGEIKISKGCSSDGKRRSINIQRLAKAPRYAIISGSDSQGDKEKAMILELFNHPDNWDGSYLRVLLGTEVIMTGFNLKEASAVIKMGSPWNYANALQIRTRIFRTDGHLLTMQRQRQAGYTEYPLFDITLASVTPGDYQVITKKAPLSNNYESYDLKTVWYAESKDVQNSEVHRAYKAAAIDCMLHRERNVRPTDVPGSRETDYHPQSYECMEPQQELIMQNNSLYDLEYADIEVQRCVTDIIALLRHRRPVSDGTLDLVSLGDYPAGVPIRDVYHHLSDQYRYSIIDKALQQLVTQKMTFTDGYQRFCHAVVEGAMIVLVGNHYDPRVQFRACHKGLSLALYQERIMSVITRPVEVPITADNIMEAFERAAVKYYYQGDRTPAVVDIIKKCAAYHCVVPTQRLSGRPLSHSVTAVQRLGETKQYFIPLLNIITGCFNGFINDVIDVYDVNNINTSKGTGNKRSKIEPIDSVGSYTGSARLMFYKAHTMYECLLTMPAPPDEALWWGNVLHVMLSMPAEISHLVFDWNNQRSYGYIQQALTTVDNYYSQYTHFSRALLSVLPQLAQAARWFNTDTLVEGDPYPVPDFLYWFYYELLPGMPHSYGDLTANIKLYAYQWVSGAVTPQQLTVFHILDCLDRENDYARVITVERSGAGSDINKSHRVRYFTENGWLRPPNDYIDTNDIPVKNKEYKFKLMPMVFNDLQYLMVSRMQRVMEVRCRVLFSQLGVRCGVQACLGVYGVLLLGLFGAGEDLLFTGDNTGMDTKHQFKGRSYRTVKDVLYNSIIGLIGRYSQDTGVTFSKGYTSGRELLRAATTALTHYGLLLTM